MSTATQRIDVFVQWCSENDIWLDPRLRIQWHSVDGISVHSCSVIPPLNSVVHIHKNSVLSARSCSLSEYIAPILDGPEAQHTLSLALYAEILAAESSRWFGYLQVLPVGIVDLPLFWNHGTNSDLLHDGGEGLKWLRGTEIDRHMKLHIGTDLKALNDYYFNFAEPLLLQYLEQNNNIPNSKPNLQGFYRAYSLVSSRSFLVDAYHGLSMVPVADAFNHEQENHVHLQTEFNVCAECGSLYECVHDQEFHSDCSQPTKSLPPTPRRETSELLHDDGDLDQYYEMVSNALIQANTEVFNTYGETLTNAQLLTQYGFTLDANENDCITWNVQEVYRSLRTRTDGDFQSFIMVWNKLLLTAAQDRVFESADSQLVYFHLAGPSDDLRLDGDGRISSQLWVFLALQICLREQRNGDLISVFESLKGLLAYQVALERQSESGNDEPCGVQGPPSKVNPTITSYMAELAQSVTDLCLSRKDHFGKGVDLALHHDVSSMLDAVPAEMPRTRLAISIVMSEQSILDSCISAWTDIRIIAEQH